MVDARTFDSNAHQKVYARLLRMAELMPQDLVEVALLPSLNSAKLVPSIGITEAQAQSFVRSVHKLDKAGTRAIAINSTIT